MLTLFHMPTAICAQKVRVCLAEKGLAWESRFASGETLRSAEYLAMNPGGYIPTLVHDGRIVIESRIICEYLNEAFPDRPLLPPDPYDRARVSIWTKQIDDSLHLAIYTLTCAAQLRRRYARMTPQEAALSLPLDLTKRERTLDILDKGEASHYVPAALGRFRRLVDDLDRALAQSHWLVGGAYSLADVDYTPYMRRLCDLGLSSLWADRPRVGDWLARLQARPSFSAVLADWMSPDELQRLEAGAGRAEAMFAPLLKAA